MNTTQLSAHAKSTRTRRDSHLIKMRKDTILRQQKKEQEVSIKKTPFECVSIELAKHGLLCNEPWVPIHAELTVEMFDRTNKEIGKSVSAQAAMMGAMHKDAIDYIKQAPILLAASMIKHKVLHDYRHRIDAAKHWRDICCDGGKLRAVMRHFEIPYALRKLQAGTMFCVLNSFDTCKALAEINQSTLAQFIPLDWEDQWRWLQNINQLYAHCVYRFGSCSPDILEWAVKNLKENFPIVHIYSIADYIGRVGHEFNPSLNLAQTQARSQEWHETISQQSAEANFRDRYGIGWQDKIECPLPSQYKLLVPLDDPDTLTIIEFEFIALQSGEDLYLEGQTMHHCVATYMHDVLYGRSVIYSIRQGEKRFATMELVHGVSHGKILHNDWVMNQIKGPYNSSPNADIHEAASLFIKLINKKVKVGNDAADR